MVPRLPLADFVRDLEDAAARQRVTTRYVQMLFEEDCETFTDYALEQRLQTAHRMLRDARLNHLTIAAIAYRGGFGDLSHFNRNFKRRFGETPSEIRRLARALRQTGDAEEAGEVG